MISHLPLRIAASIFTLAAVLPPSGRCSAIAAMTNPPIDMLTHAVAFAKALATFLTS